MTTIRNVTHAENIRLSDDGKKVIIIDQTALPNRVVHLELDELQPCYDAIRQLQVRGAPAIGIFAGSAQSGARAPLWDVARVMLALSPGLFWPEDVRKVGSLPADPRKGSVLNDRRQQVPRPRSATGLLREPEGRLGAGAFLASCRWTPKPGRRAEGHRACAGRPRGLRVRGSRRRAGCLVTAPGFGGF